MCNIEIFLFPGSLEDRYCGLINTRDPLYLYRESLLALNLLKQKYEVTYEPQSVKTSFNDEVVKI